MDLQLYAEKNFWSQRYKLWDKYFVHKPRLPKPDEASHRWVDAPSSKPASIPQMIGTHNAEIIASLRELREQFEDSKILPNTIIIQGPSGSGKTTICQRFLAELSEDMGLTRSQESKFWFYADAGKFKNLNNLWLKIGKFAEPVLERYISAPFRVVVIDNSNLMPPSQQQGLKKVMEVYFLRTRWIFVTKNKDKLITFVQTNATVVKTCPISEKDALTVVLNILHKNKVGYDRDGVHAVFDMHRQSMSLSYILDTLQKVFIERFYVSEENVAKAAGTKLSPPEKASSCAVEPMERCPICTLVPPCKHTNIDDISNMGLARRDELPTYPGGMGCPEFMRYGRCSIFNRYGHCSLDHPKDAHKIAVPVRRCTRCTIPWPCNHCSYSKDRLRLINMLDELEQRLSVLKQLVVPEPSLAISNYMVSE